MAHRLKVGDWVIFKEFAKKHFKNIDMEIPHKIHRKTQKNNKYFYYLDDVPFSGFSAGFFDKVKNKNNTLEILYAK